MIKRSLIFLFILYSSIIQAFDVLNLKTEYQINPIGIDTQTPHFSWQLKSDIRNTTQKAYQIIVSKDVSQEDIVYDSGIIESDESTNVLLDDLSLEPCIRYYWQVNVWDNHGNSTTSASHSFFETGLFDSGWDGAKWVSCSKEELDSPSAMRFLKKFYLNSKVRRARLYSSALGVYTLNINGKRVGATDRDGRMVYDELMPGYTDYRNTIFYMTHDVTSLLQEGNNAIGAEVSSGWWLGRISGGIYSSTDLAFIGKLVIELANGETVTIISDTDWISSKSSTILSGEIYDGEVFDARYVENWTDPEFDSSSWKGCIEDVQSKGVLMGHEGPTIRVHPDLERKPKSMTVYEGIKNNGTKYGEINTVGIYSDGSSISLKKGQTLVVDFGQNASGWVKFKVLGKSGTTLSLKYAEMLNDSGDIERGNDDAKGTLYTIALRTAQAQGQYVLAGLDEGETYRPTSTFYGFRYCDMTASDDIDILWITAETIMTANEEGSYIKTDNLDINQLYSNIQWGQRSNFLSVPTDCPQRDERLGWTADTQVFSMAAMYNAHVQGFYHKWMRDVRDGQFPTGEFPNVAPCKWVNNHGASGWADAGVIMPWNVYTMYGDKAIIEENYDSMVKYVNWLETQTEGDFIHIGAGTRYGDWLSFEDTDSRYISVAYYGYIADLMARMSSVLSTDPNDYYALQAERYEQLFKEIRKEFKIRYWDEETNTLRHSSQCAMLMALKYNLLDDEYAIINTRERLRLAIKNNGNRLSTGFLGTAIINQTLSENEMDDLAYELLFQHECPSWLYSVDQGATTMWERWNSYTLENGFSKDSGMNSFNHYAYGAVGEWLYRNMVGIAPDCEKPGFQHIYLKPTFDYSYRISKVDAKYSSIYGDIDVKWNYEENGVYQYEVTIPANTTATLILPTPNEDKTLFEDETDICEPIGISNIVTNDDSSIMTLGSGHYKLSYTARPTVSVNEINNDNLCICYNQDTKIASLKSRNNLEYIKVFSYDGNLVANAHAEHSINLSKLLAGIYILTAKDICGNHATIKIKKL